MFWSPSATDDCYTKIYNILLFCDEDAFVEQQYLRRKGTVD